MNLENNPKNDLWVFREGRKNITGAALLAQLANSANNLHKRPNDNTVVISALIIAGEFETGIADAGSAAEVSVQSLTDALAGAFVGDASDNERVPSLLRELAHFEIPEYLSIAPPEGFAYYALHPHDFARLAQQVGDSRDPALVIGIRSIGTTLGAIVRASLKMLGRKTERITVRPTGHPYDRVTRFSMSQLQKIAEWNARGADFIVVDEGPGRSGSSFLSVAEALVKAGVATNRIRLLGSRPVDVNQLCAENARERWRQFTFLWPEPSVYTRFSDHSYIGGGNWREVLWPGPWNWPACWPQMERLKFLSPDRKFIHKFEGFGRFGEEVLARAEALARAGFSCEAENAGDGMIRYPLIEGPPANAGDVSTTLLQWLARYCAFRASEFRNAGSQPTQVPSMLRFNVQQEFGIELGVHIDELCSSDPILTDGRMQPHEWIRAPHGNFLKLDGCTHGDDHFFPGPTDIAWDLAGTIVEWDLDRDAVEFFLSEFRHTSGRGHSHNLEGFVLAYTVFRLAYYKMALSTVTGAPEELRLRAAYRHYRSLAERQIHATGAVNPSCKKVLAQATLPGSSIRSGTTA